MTPPGPCQPPDEIDQFVRIRTIGLNGGRRGEMQRRGG